MECFDWLSFVVRVLQYGPLPGNYPFANSLLAPSKFKSQNTKALPRKGFSEKLKQKFLMITAPEL